MFTKVCGLTTEAQIDKAVELGYDAIGVVTYAKSKRYCRPEKAVRLAAYAGDRIKRFVVGVDYSDVAAAAQAFDYIQIYEPRQVPHLALASKNEPPPGLDFDFFVYDASIGSGTFSTFPDWLKDRQDRLLVAGGLNPDNVCGVIRELRPFGVDVSSGVEIHGVKDFGLMKTFIDAVNACKD